MARDYSRHGLSEVSANASTISPQLLEVSTLRIHCQLCLGFQQDIEVGECKVVISSPEAYKNANKLRRLLLSEKLKPKCHVSVTDGAHIIRF